MLTHVIGPTHILCAHIVVVTIHVVIAAANLPRRGDHALLVHTDLRRTGVTVIAVRGHVTAATGRLRVQALVGKTHIGRAWIVIITIGLLAAAAVHRLKRAAAL